MTSVDPRGSEVDENVNSEESIDHQVHHEYAPVVEARPAGITTGQGPGRWVQLRVCESECDRRYEHGRGSGRTLKSECECKYERESDCDCDDCDCVCDCESACKVADQYSARSRDVSINGGAINAT